MDIKGGGFLSIEQVQDQFLGKNNNSKKADFHEVSQFQDILERVNGNDTVRFSKHAMSRLSDRGIAMTQNQVERLNEATAQAKEKGINESLIMVDQMAFIVNVPNNTVVTALDQKDQSTNKVFTNIDGAVIA